MWWPDRPWGAVWGGSEIEMPQRHCECLRDRNRHGETLESTIREMERQRKQKRFLGGRESL